MAGNKRVGNSRKRGGNNKPAKKTKATTMQSFFTEADGGLRSANILYGGKHVLLSAKFVYKNGKVPKDENGYLFQYHVETVNKGLGTATIEYDGKFIREDGDMFENYPEENEVDNVMEDYRMALFKEDHELYNTCLARVNAKKNDALEVEKEDEENKKKSALDDVTDIEEKIVNEGMKPCEVLESEFESSGALLRRTIQKGVNAGKEIINQEWVHPPSQYKCVRDGKIGKDEFKYDSLWKAAEVIVKKGLSGHVRLKRIMELNKTKSATIAEANGEEIYNKEADTVLGIKGVVALVSSKSPLSFFEDRHVKDWIHSLNPSHRLPYRIMRIRMLQVVQDLNVLEFARIVKDRRRDLIEAFVCGQTDMWKDSHRKENFGALVFTVVAHRYTLNDGREYFMSAETAERLKMEGKLVSCRPRLAVLEFVGNFERFEQAKTIENVAEWMEESIKELRIEDGDINQLCADGAGNAKGSIAEYEALARTRRSNNVDIDVCISHQDQRSAGYASGTIDFANPVNEELGSIIRKSHEITVHISRAPLRMSVYNDVQQRRNHKPQLKPIIGNDTRWDSWQLEAARNNLIMGDICTTLLESRRKGGPDEKLPTEDAKSLSYTDEDKIILRQFEAAGYIATRLSKFTQSNDNAWAYVLFMIRHAIQQARLGCFLMHEDVSHKPSQLHPDLRKRGRHTILVYDPEIINEPTENDSDVYTSWQEMDPCIITYLQEYADDLEMRLGVGIEVKRLPVALAVSALLNPMFGREPLIVGSGLMSSTQYTNARKSILQMMQDYLDAKEPCNGVNVNDSDSEDSRDGIIPNTENLNFSKANTELIAFEKYKKVKYHPKFGCTGKVFASVKLEEHEDEEGNPGRSICMGSKVTQRGSDLPSKKNLADYIDSNGRCDVLSFFGDHKREFPTLFIIAQRMASRRVVEVGCERFFSLSGYVSAPRRTRLGVRTYERLSMLTSNINSVYVDPEMAAKEYLRRCKSGLWKKKFAEDALKSWNLERLIEAELFHHPIPDELTMEDLMKEELVNDNRIMEIDD